MKLFFEKHASRFVWLIIAFTAIRLAVAPQFGLGVDEAHYVLYAKYLDLSYFDHPPMVGWFHALIYYSLGNSEFLSRLPAILLFAVTSLFLHRWILSVTGSAAIAFAGLLAVNLSFMMNALALMLLPDSILLLLMFPLMALTRRLETDTSILTYVQLGLLFGILGLTKYTAVLFVPAFLAYFIIIKAYNRILTPKLLITGITALLVISPVLLWNYQNDFASFTYQTGHVIGDKIKLKYVFRSFGAQFGAYSPFFYIIALYGFIRSLRIHERNALPAKVYGGAILIFFTLTSFTSTVLPHWTSPFFLLFIPIGIQLIWQDGRKLMSRIFTIGMWFTGILVILVYIELGFHLIPFPDYKTPYRDIAGYPQIMEKANEYYERSPSDNKGVAVTNWTYGSRMRYYSLPYDLPVFVTDRKYTQFDFWEKTDPKGMDLLFVKSAHHRTPLGNKILCESLNEVGTLDIILSGNTVDTIHYYWCNGFIKRK